MKKGNLSRAQAVEIVGLCAVETVGAVNCEPTNRVGFNGACQGDVLTEWSASVNTEDGTLTAYYYTTNEDDRIIAENGGDGSYINWVISGYEIY